MTFAELAAAILEHPDCAVDFDWAFVQSVHSYTKCAVERVRIRYAEGINLKTDIDLNTSKKMLQHIHDAITAGKTLPAGSVKRINIMSPNARRR